MVEPAWFLSTLAQSVAALIGFVIAFTAALYTNRKSRERRDVMRIWDCIREFRTVYRPALRSFGGTLLRQLEEVNSWIPGITDFQSATDTELEQWIEQQEGVEQSAKVYAHIRRIETILTGINSPYDMTEKNLDRITRSIGELQQTFSQNEDGQEFYSEITGVEQPPPGYYRADIINPNESLNTWFDRHFPEFDPRRDTSSSLFPELSGRNLYSLSVMTNRMNEDFVDCVMGYFRNFPGGNPHENAIWVLRTSILLAFIGIFAPLMLLITIPDEPNHSKLLVPAWEYIQNNQFGIQTFLLIFTGALALGLFFAVFRMVNFDDT